MSNFAIKTSRAVIGDSLIPAVIVVEDGQVVSVEGSDVSVPGVEIRDVGDRVVMPGLIDSHVHINEPGRTEWEGFQTATKAACAGGVTTVVDMPLNSSPVTTTTTALQAKLDASAGRLFVDVGFYGGLIPGNAHELDGLIDAGVLGVKAFLCHSGIDEFPNATEEDLHAAMPMLAARGVPLLVHAEMVPESCGDVALRERRCPRGYAATRPPEYELRAIGKMIEWCRQTRCRVHIVHLATREALPMLRAAREEGLPITVETCPHYLNFAAAEIEDGDTRFKCAPPIRDEENREALVEALLSGEIDTVGTDHSPAPPSIKEFESGDFGKAWGGISSLQLLLPALWTAVRERDATPVDVTRMASRAPAELLGLENLGTIEVGRPANLVVWDPEASFEVEAAALYHRHRITPYEGRTLFGVVHQTYLCGELVFDGEIAPKPRGRPLLREA